MRLPHSYTPLSESLSPICVVVHEIQNSESNRPRCLQKDCKIAPPPPPPTPSFLPTIPSLTFHPLTPLRPGRGTRMVPSLDWQGMEGTESTRAEVRR